MNHGNGEKYLRAKGYTKNNPFVLNPEQSNILQILVSVLSLESLSS